MSGALRIGQVRDMLVEEFPDLTISKLRFLEDQGLVTPERSKGGYRLYAADDVGKLRHVLRMQRDEFLPLKVIREQIRRQVDRPAAQRPSPPVGDDESTQAAVAEAGAPVIGDAAALADHAGVDPAFVRECSEFGLIGGAADGYDESDARVVMTAARLARYGIGVRHLRQVGAAARGQAALVGSYAVARRRGGADGQAAREEAASFADDLLVLVRDLFVREARRQLSSDPPRPDGIVRATTGGRAAVEERA